MCMYMYISIYIFIYIHIHIYRAPFKFLSYSVKRKFICKNCKSANQLIVGTVGSWQIDNFVATGAKVLVCHLRE